MIDRPDPQATLRRAIVEAVSGCPDIGPDIIDAIARCVAAPENRWALAVLAREGRSHVVAVKRGRDRRAAPRVTRWFDCPACMFDGVAEFSRYCENCGAKIDWMA